MGINFIPTAKTLETHFKNAVLPLLECDLLKYAEASDQERRDLVTKIYEDLIAPAQGLSTHDKDIVTVHAIAGLEQAMMYLDLDMMDEMPEEHLRKNLTKNVNKMLEMMGAAAKPVAVKKQEPIVFFNRTAFPSPRNV